MYLGTLAVVFFVFSSAIGCIVRQRVPAYNCSMGKFALGLVVALAIGMGLYYFLLSDAPRDDAVNEELDRGAEIEMQINEVNTIPPNAVMEDGTIPE